MSEMSLYDSYGNRLYFNAEESAVFLDVARKQPARDRIRRRTYTTRDAARQDVFDYIEMFYNTTRKHTNNGMLSPVDYETEHKKMNEAGV